MITSRQPACCGDKRVHPARLLRLWRSPGALYRVLWTGRMSADLAMMLMPVIRAVERREIKFRRRSPAQQ
ncbi:MAG: hypothetical protein J2P54_08545 [Bradyrhizobiaceae bacterium]|nr:hypothetical protein [Bradyrhizobiaceae bacterium]